MFYLIGEKSSGELIIRTHISEIEAEMLAMHHCLVRYAVKPMAINPVPVK